MAFSVIVLIGYVMDESSTRYVIAAVLIAALSTASYHGVEKPLHTSPVFEGLPRKRDRRNAWLSWRTAVFQSSMLGILGLLATASVILTLLTPAVGHVNGARPVALPMPSEAPEADQSHPEQAALTREIVASLNATSFPALNPDVESLGLAGLRDQWRRDGCVDVTNDAQASRCTFGESLAGRMAVVVGDSYAMSWMPGLRKALNDNGYRVTQLTKGHCPAWNVAVTMNETPFAECDEQHRWVNSYLQRQKPDLVVLTTASYLADSLTSKNTGTAMLKEVSEGLRSTIANAKDAGAGAGAEVIVLGSPPGSEDLQICVKPNSTPEGCWGPASTANAKRISRTEADTAAAMGVRFVDVFSWFCQYDHCPAFVGTTPVYVDGSHLTVQYSERLTPLLEAAIRG